MKASKKKGLFYPIIILFGILIMGTLIALFAPAMFASMSASGDVAKYDQTVGSGSDAVRASNGVDALTIGIYSLPANPGFVAFVLIAAVIVILVVFRMVMKGKGSHV